MKLIIATVLFAVFCLDVAIGATSGKAFLSDVQAMVLLLAASIAFVSEILRRESKARK